MLDKASLVRPKLCQRKNDYKSGGFLTDYSLLLKKIRFINRYFLYYTKTPIF